MLEESLEREELIKVVNKLVSNLEVYAVVLVGSRARGDYKPWSDYDTVVIADFKEKYLDRIKRVLELLGDVQLNIEPHPYTLAEAVEMLKKGNPLIVDAVSEGIVLYSRKEFEEITRLYKELVSKGLRKTETSIIVPTA